MDSGGLKEIVTRIGIFASILLPLWNIPLIVRIIRRKSSDDLSMAWAFGVWVCMTLMVPAALISPDVVFRIFAVVNWTFFSLVVLVAWKYRRK